MTSYIKKSSLKTLITATALALVAVTAAPIFMALSGTAFAQEEGRQFSAKAGEAVNEALQLINSNQHSAALSQLSNVLTFPDLNAYERSTVYQMQGSSYYELNQYGPAISAFENAINAGGLLPNEADGLRVNIAQLMIANGQYSQGAQALENYLNRGGQQKPQYTEMLVQAWVQSENYSRALPWAEKWFRAASPKERKHFDLMNFLYNNLGQQGRQADIVKQMINRWPEDKALWDAWASMLANGGREQEAFEVTKMLVFHAHLRKWFSCLRSSVRHVNISGLFLFLKVQRPVPVKLSSMPIWVKRFTMKASVKKRKRLSRALSIKAMMLVSLGC